MKRKYVIAVTAMLVITAFTACSTTGNGHGATNNVTEVPVTNNQKANTDNEDQQETFQSVDVSAGGWNIIIENIQRDTSMKNAATVLGYTDTVTNEYEKEAPEGKEYFMVKLKISKGDSTQDFQWGRLELSDNDNNVYQRIDDIFIDDLGMKRLPGTDLNFGTHEGWIAFEVNQAADGLTLTYQFDNEKMEYHFE